MEKLYDIAIVSEDSQAVLALIKALENCSLNTKTLTVFSDECNNDYKNRLLSNNPNIKLSHLNGENVIKNRADFAFFCGNAHQSKKYAPLFSALSCVVIDNSDAFKNEENVPIVLASVNPENAFINSGIISCPSPSAAMVLPAIHLLNKKYGIKRLLANCLVPYGKVVCDCITPLVGSLLVSGASTHEQTVTDEIRKILNNNDININISSVLVPICTGESAIVNIELNYQANINDVLRMLIDAGLSTSNCPNTLDATSSDKILIGRVRRDFSQQNSISLWITADNIYSATALNMVQIAKLLI